jgi:hypothetical protein
MSGRFLGNWYAPPAHSPSERIRAADYLVTRGTRTPPAPPRDITAQSGPRGIYLTWSNPPVFNDIAGWRVYKDDELTLYHGVHDRGTKQAFVEATAGTTPPKVNIFVSSVNVFGAESVKVQVQGSALAETGAPVMPPAPPGYTITKGGGGDTSTGRTGFQQK